MQRTVPNVWCQGNAEEAGRFYAAVLPNATAKVTASYPTENLPDFQRAFAGQPLVLDVTVSGYRIRLINAGDEFWPTLALSFILNVDPLTSDGGEDEARAWSATLWEACSAGGKIRMPLGEYPHSKPYGWIEDRFGVNWQSLLTDIEGERRPLLTPQFLFTGEAAQAQQGIDFYAAVIPGSGRGTLIPQPGGTGASCSQNSPLLASGSQRWMPVPTMISRSRRDSHWRLTVRTRQKLIHYGQHSPL